MTKNDKCMMNALSLTYTPDHPTSQNNLLPDMALPDTPRPQLLTRRILHLSQLCNLFRIRAKAKKARIISDELSSSIVEHCTLQM